MAQEKNVQQIIREYAESKYGFTRDQATEFAMAVLLSKVSETEALRRARLPIKEKTKTE